MNRRVVGGVAALLLLAAAGWFFFVRDRGSKPATAPATTPAATAAQAGSATAKEGAPPLVGLTPHWIRDADKPGKLRLEGQVVDDHGDPIGAATITLDSVPPRTATSEADGSFAFDKLTGRDYTLAAIAGKRVGGPVKHRLTSTSDPIVIRMVAGAKLVVTVVDGDNKPVAKADVKTLGTAEQTATTAADGVATVEPVHPGWVAVQASAPGYALGNGFTQVGGAGGTGQLTIILRPGYSISGRVVDEAGKPIAGVNVATAAMWDLPGSGHKTETDAKGAFTVAALAAGTHTLVATDGEHAPARSASISVESKPVDGVEIVMQRGGRIAGRVLDHAKVPVASATVRVSGDGQQMWLISSRQTSTDETGAFELRGLARTKLKVRAEGETGASEIALVDLTTVNDKPDLELVLSVRGTIAGIVVDEAGQPVAEVQVNASPDVLGTASQDAMVLAGMSSATTDGGGRFTIRGLPDGEYRVRAARASGRGRYQWGAQGVKAKTGDANVKITLATPGSVRGKLALENGKPPKGANVRLGYQPLEIVKPDGTFTITDVEPGTFDLYARGPEFADMTKKDIVVASSKPTDLGTITLERGRKVTGKVIDANGNPVANARIKAGDILYTLQGADDQMSTFEEMSGIRLATSDQAGSFTLIGIPKKLTNVLADHASGRSNAVEIPAGTDDPPPITLTLHGLGSIKGKVTAQGQPVPGATVTATPKGGGSQVQLVQSEADGSFTLTKISEGTVVLGVMQQDRANMAMKSTSVEVAVTAGKQTEVTLEIPVGQVSLVVEVKPLPNNQVDTAQVFLVRNIVAIKTAKEINDLFLAGKGVGMKFWKGPTKPLPTFDELVPGDYSVCTIPITGDLNDVTFQQRLQLNLDKLAVYCKQANVAPSPAKQTVVHEVPAMTPLPN